MVRLPALPTRLIDWLRREENAHLARAWRVSIGSDLRPTVPEHVAQVPARLHGRTEQQFLVLRFAASPVLPQAKQHFGQCPASAEQVVSFFGQLTALLHQTMAEGYVKVQCPLPEQLWEVSAVLGAVEMIAQLKAHSEHRVCSFILLLPNIEKSLAKVAAQVEIIPHTRRRRILMLVGMETLTKLPASFPCFSAGIWRAGAVEHSGSMNGAETSQCVTKSPAVMQSCSQCGNFIIIG